MYVCMYDVSSIWGILLVDQASVVFLYQRIASKIKYSFKNTSSGNELFSFHAWFALMSVGIAIIEQWKPKPWTLKQENGFSYVRRQSGGLFMPWSQIHNSDKELRDVFRQW